MIITAQDLIAHQISYYIDLLKDSKCDKQKRYLRSELYRLKKLN